MTPVSACVVTWNGGERLLRLLASLDGCHEVVVVDNASSDGTADRVAAAHPGIRLVRNAENAGYARAMNQAVRAATGDLVLLLNDDVLVPAGALPALVRALEAAPGAVAAGPRLVGEDGREQTSASGVPTLRGLLHRVSLLRWTGAFRAAHHAWRRPPVAEGPVPALCGAALLIRREALLRRPLDEGFPFGLEDADLCARLAADGPLVFAPGVALVHTGGVATAANLAFAYRGFEVGYARFLRRHQGRGPAALYKLLVTLDQPARALGTALEGLGRLLVGRRDRARESARRLGAILRFMATGLPALWWA
ncbi:MAG: glycosyltransferase family 2 protein [Planctomycetes bacterium]|nr:glycosyltransferase family 2 protein [Planctomycetota bacterium]